MTVESSRAGTQNAELPDVTWPPQLCFSVRLLRATEHITVVVLQGEVNAQTTPRFRDAVTQGIDKGARAIVVDLSEVSFIDAAGLGVIVLAARRLRPGAIALVCPHRNIVHIFRICRLDRLLDIFETCEQAVRNLLQSNSTQEPRELAGTPAGGQTARSPVMMCSALRKSSPQT